MTEQAAPILVSLLWMYEKRYLGQEEKDRQEYEDYTG